MNGLNPYAAQSQGRGGFNAMLQKMLQTPPKMRGGQRPSAAFSPTMPQFDPTRPPQMTGNPYTVPGGFTGGNLFGGGATTTGKAPQKLFKPTPLMNPRPQGMARPQGQARPFSALQGLNPYSQR